MSEKDKFIFSFRNSIWWFGVACWIFGLTDRTLSVLSDNWISSVGITQLFTAVTFFLFWLILKPISTKLY